MRPLSRHLLLQVRSFYLCCRSGPSVLLQVRSFYLCCRCGPSICAAGAALLSLLQVRSFYLCCRCGPPFSAAGVTCTWPIPQIEKRGFCILPCRRDFLLFVQTLSPPALPAAVVTSSAPAGTVPSFPAGVHCPSCFWRGVAGCPPDFTTGLTFSPSPHLFHRVCVTQTIVVNVAKTINVNLPSLQICSPYLVSTVFIYAFRSWLSLSRLRKANCPQKVHGA